MENSKLILLVSRYFDYMYRAVNPHEGKGVPFGSYFGKQIDWVWLVNSVKYNTNPVGFGLFGAP